MEYLKKDDPTITEIEIPAECHGFPVTRIWDCFDDAIYIKHVVIPPSVSIIDTASFCRCKALESAELYEGLERIGSLAFRETNLKSITFPKTLKDIGYFAFACCHNLERVTFNSANPKISFGQKVFVDCFKLPADVTLMGLVNSCDITKPFDEYAFHDSFSINGRPIPGQDEYLKYIRPDVFELAIKNDCFRSVDISFMLKFLIKNKDADSLLFAEENGLFKSRAVVEECIEHSAKEGLTELTAYLLDLKKRKFGFKGGNGFEL